MAVVLSGMNQLNGISSLDARKAGWQGLLRQSSGFPQIRTAEGVPNSKNLSQLSINIFSQS